MKSKTNTPSYSKFWLLDLGAINKLIWEQSRCKIIDRNNNKNDQKP